MAIGIIIVVAVILFFGISIAYGITWNLLYPEEAAERNAQREAEDRANQAQREAEDNAKQTQENKERAYEEAVERKEAAAERQREIESAEFEKEYEKYICSEEWYKDIGGYDWRVERGLEFNEDCCLWVYPDLGCPP